MAKCSSTTITTGSSWFRAFRVLLYSTQTLNPNHVDATATTLYHALVRFREPSVTPVLDQWVGDGRPVDQQDLHRIIKQLRKFGRYKHALQICEWMENKHYFDHSHKDISVMLDLISKVYGLQQAEEYFNKIPNDLRVWQVYGSLLNCYAQAKSLTKAEATMHKMRELGYSGSLAYNVMMGLYSVTNKFEKLDMLMEEMEQKGIHIDKFTYCIRLNVYAKTSEIHEMEKLLLKMEADPHVQMEWHAYVTVANGYLKAGDGEKALKCLKKSEYLIRPSQRKSAYEILLTLYGRTGRKDEVLRVWNLYENLGKFYNHGYLCIMSALNKLDCIDDVEKLYNEWEKKHTFFDFHVPNLMITIYCKIGMVERADLLVKKLIESGKKPNASTWSRMALGYLKNDETEKAIDALKKSISSSLPGWTVDTTTLSACLDALNSNGNLDEAQEIIRLLQEKGHLSEVVFNDGVKTLSKDSAIEI